MGVNGRTESPGGVFGGIRGGRGVIGRSGGAPPPPKAATPSRVKQGGT